jgi:hypothetical protein
MKSYVHDPTSELAPLLRPRQAPPPSLDGKTVALFDLGKIRSDEFLDSLEQGLAERGIEVVRSAKPTNARPAERGLIDDVATRADFVIEALAD